MSKKIFIAAFLLAAATAVFAVDFGLSAGGGALLGANFTKSETDPTITNLGGQDTSIAMAYKTKAFDVGAFVFVDATYAELSVAYYAEVGKVTDVVMMSQSAPDQDYVSHVIIVDLLGKYPFVLNEKFTVFPALGVGIKLPVAGNKNSDKEHDVTWGVVGKVGGGLDFTLTQALFLRCEVLFAYQFISDREATIDIPQVGKLDFDFKAEGYNLGPQVKVGVGYKIL